MNSIFLDKINMGLGKVQSKLGFIAQNSSIVKNIDDVTVAFMSLLLIMSTFCQTAVLGVIACMVIVTSIVKLLVTTEEKILLSKADGALIVFFLFLTFSMFNSILLEAAFEGYLKYVIYIGYYFAIVPIFRKRKRNVLRIVLLIAGLCSIESFYALLQSKTVIAGATWQDYSYVNPEDAISRIYGSLKPFNPNLLAGYLIAGISAVIGVTLLTIEKRHRKSFFIAVCAVLVSLLAIFQTGCRGAYLAVVSILLGFMLVSYRIVFYDFAAFNHFKKLWVNIASGIVGMGVIALAFMPKIVNRIMSIFLLRGDSSTSFRINVYKSSWEMFVDNPVFGIGPGNQTFREIYGLYMLTGFDALAAYSVPLEIAVETGVLGFVSFFAFIIILFIEAVKYICQDQSIRGKIYVSVCIISVLGLMTHGLFDTVFFRPQIQFVFWTIVAILNGVLFRKEAAVQKTMECV